MIEADKLDKVRRVMTHNGGKVIEESHAGEDVRLRVAKDKVPQFQETY